MVLSKIEAQQILDAWDDSVSRQAGVHVILGVHSPIYAELKKIATPLIPKFKENQVVVVSQWNRPNELVFYRKIKAVVIDEIGCKIRYIMDTGSVFEESHCRSLYQWEVEGTNDITK